MAIRIRKIKGHVVALCAAETRPEPGDLYLDDGVHAALSTKFAIDWDGEGLVTAGLAHPPTAKLMKEEEAKKEGGDKE